MDEVKKIPDIMGQGKKDVRIVFFMNETLMTIDWLVLCQIRDYFKMFIEDYNTATMPHEKYYNYEAWEIAEYRRKQDKAAHKSSDVPEAFNDEEERRREILNARAKAEKKEFSDLLGKMSANRDQLESMRRQEGLKVELQMAYKQGDMTTVRRIEKMLAPDEEKGTGVKHPWA